MLFASVLLETFVTNFTLDVTAPLELAFALPGAADLVSIVATSTAQEVAAFEALCRSITVAVDGSQRALI